MGKNKHHRRSTLSNNEVTYADMVEDLRLTISEKDATIAACREELKDQEIRLLKQQIEILKTSQSNLGMGSSAAHSISRNSARLSFSDLEESMTKFSGEDSYHVSKFIEDFESASQIYGWTEIEQIVFAKRLITSVAKLALRSEKSLNSWEHLKTYLSKEFGKKENSAELHELMRQRKKKASESFLEYFFAMKELGTKANLEDVAIIQYLIQGIDDDEKNKVMLYGAESLAKFKEKLEVYALITQKSKARQRPNFSQSKRVVNKIRCYNCGTDGHMASSCPRKSDGAKCFACHRFGHKSTNCPNKNNKEERTVAFLNSMQENREMTKDISVSGVPFKAYVDTGSDLTLVREDAYKRLKHPLMKGPISFRGVGSDVIHTLGSFKAQISIDGYEYEDVLHVVSQNILPKEFLLGKTLLSQLEIRISPSGIFTTPVIGHDCFRCLNAIVEETLDESTTTFASVEHIVPAENRNRVHKMMTEYKPKKNYVAEGMELTIVLTDDNPVFQPPRRLPKAECDMAKKQIDEWLAEGIVVPSTSEYASPIVLVNKKDGTKRLCVDFRLLNKKIVRDHFPLPLIADLIDSLSEARIFSTLDLKNGFFHMPVSKPCQKYTAFVTPFGQFEFTRAPFGLCTSPTRFQRYINYIFTDLIRKEKVLVYIDDVIVLGKNVEDAIDSLGQVLKIAADHGLQIKWTKCQLIKDSINYLGYCIKNGKVQPSDEKIIAVKKFPVPKTVKALQSFLGLSGYFRKFIPEYATIARPLSDLLRNGAKFTFQENQLKAFQTLKEKLCSKPSLLIFNRNAYTEVHTDASKLGLGAILLQRSPEDNKLHPVLFLSRKTTPREENLSSYELEALAVVNAIKKFRVYLLGTRFKLITDCSAFKCTMSKKDISPKIARWAIMLSEFSFDIEHRSGTQMRHVDALSRYPTSMLVEEDSLIHRIAAAQRKDDGFKAILEILKDESEFENYLEERGVLFKMKDGLKLLAVPRNLQPEVIRRIHEEGHFGSRKTEMLIARNYFIPHLKEKVNKSLESCIPCLLSNKHKRSEGYLHSIHKGNLPLETFHMDHLGPMTATRKGYRYILAIIDAFTKFVWLFPTKTTTSCEALQKLNVLQATFGNPSRIITDRGAAFTSKIFQEFCENQQIEHIQITTGVPRANGQIERVHRVVIAILTKLSIRSEDEWYKHIYKVQMWINNSIHRGTKTTPFQLLIGTPMKTENDVHLKELLEQEFIDLFQDEREESRREAAEQILKLQLENQKTYNRRRKPATKYEIGELVAIRRTQFGTGLKIRPTYLGPYKITKVKSKDRYDVIKIGHHEGPIRTSVSADHMKYFNGEEMQSDTEDEYDENDSSTNDLNRKDAPSLEKEEELSTQTQHTSATSDQNEETYQRNSTDQHDEPCQDDKAC